jgi:hypothetical protein
VIDDGTMRDRFVIRHNPEEAKRDEAVRQQLLRQLQDAIDGTEKLTAPERERLHGKPVGQPRPQAVHPHHQERAAPDRPRRHQGSGAHG